MKTSSLSIPEQQAIIRKASPGFLSQQQVQENPGLGFVLDHLLARNKPQGPTNLEELSAALRNPITPKPVTKRCYNALEAMAAWKPLTMERVQEIMSEESAARDAIIKEYQERTGKQIEYCEACHLGVCEWEEDLGSHVVVHETECEDCKGLGIFEIKEAGEQLNP